MQWLETEPRSEHQVLRHWIYASLAVLLAAITTWALYATQETWRPPNIAEHQKAVVEKTSNAEIEALEAELAQIQRRLDELRSNQRR
jgi:hypothetical protein